MKSFAAIFAFSVLLGASGPAFAENLYETFSRKGTVKAFIQTPVNSTGKDKVYPQELQKAIEEALAARKSLRFVPASSAADADIVVEADVKEVFWTPHDPVDMIVGIGGTAMDAAIAEEYVRMQAEITVKDGKGRALWSDKLRSTITKKGMKEEEAYHLINADMAKEFVSEAFAKKRKR